MPSGHFAKAIHQLYAVRKLNAGTGDANLGGLINSLPSSFSAPGGSSSQPGDRAILSVADALAISDTSVGTLYDGLYVYYLHDSASTATATRGRLVFHDLAAADSAYQVTPDEDANITVRDWAGITITATVTKGYYWWAQVAGKVVARFRGTLTGTGAVGVGTYAAAQGAGADVGTLDVTASAANPTFTYALGDNIIQNYIGVAEAAPVGGALSVIRIPCRPKKF